MKKKLRLPPYGQLLTLQLNTRQELRNGVWLFVGSNAWQYAKQHLARGQAVLVLPHGKEPEQFIWPVRNLPVLVFDLHPTRTAEHLLKRLALELLKSHAEIVHLVSLFNDAPLTVFYRDGQYMREGHAR